MMKFRDEETVRCGIGKLFKHTGIGCYNGHHYLLAKIDQQRVALVNLSTGHHWSTPVAVEDRDYLSKGEWRMLVSDGSFTLVENPYHEA